MTLALAYTTGIVIGIILGALGIVKLGAWAFSQNERHIPLPKDD